MHNIEEAIWLPRWLKTAGKYKRDISQNEFVFAVIMVTILAYLATFAYIVFPKNLIAVCFYYGLCGAMILNLFMHLIPAVMLRRYAPGLITSLLVVCPTNVYIIITATHLSIVSVMQVLFSTVVVGVLLVVGLPVLFKIGGKVTKEL